MEVTRILADGKLALQTAGNVIHFTNQEKKCSITIEMISGMQEVRLSFS